MANDPQGQTRPDGGDHSGGGPRTERAEGSFTDGGSLAGDRAEDRAFGAGGGAASQPGHTAPQGEGGGSMSGRGQEAPGAPRAGEGPSPAEAAARDDQVASQPGTEGVAQGLATPLQPGGIMPGGRPGASQGSLGTGGGSTGGADTGAVKRGGV